MKTAVALRGRSPPPLPSPCVHAHTPMYECRGRVIFFCAIKKKKNNNNNIPEKKKYAYTFGLHDAQIIVKYDTHHLRMNRSLAVHTYWQHNEILWTTVAFYCLRRLTLFRTIAVLLFYIMRLCTDSGVTPTPPPLAAVNSTITNGVLSSG